jgi:hypothetical protein
MRVAHSHITAARFHHASPVSSPVCSEVSLDCSLWLGNQSTARSLDNAEHYISDADGHSCQPRFQMMGRNRLGVLRIEAQCQPWRKPKEAIENEGFALAVLQRPKMMITAAAIKGKYKQRNSITLSWSQRLRCKRDTYALLRASTDYALAGTSISSSRWKRRRLRYYRKFGKRCAACGPSMTHRLLAT